MERKILIEPSKVSAVSTLAVQADKKIYIHSKYDPIREAGEWSEKVYDPTKEIYVVFGAGLLYHIKELLNRLGDRTSIVVVEPDAQIFDKLLEEPMIHELVEDPRFFLVGAENDYSDLYSILVKFNLEYMKLCSFGSYERMYAEEYQKCIVAINRALTNQEFHVNTNEKFSVEHPDNLLSNLLYMGQGVFPKVFADQFKGSSCVVVAAGPSLEKNIDLLKGMEDRVLIIAGGRTLKPLLERGIRPHFVASVDPSYANYQLFEKVLDSDVPLVATWICNKEIIKNYKGKKIFSNSSGVDDLDLFFFGEKIHEIYANGTVSTMQMDFARWLGCTNIALIGQDLTDTGGKTHADIASHGQDNREQFRKSIPVKGNTEEVVYTHEVFKHYIDILEKYVFLIKDMAQVTNCTGAGAYIEGTKVDTLENFLAEHATKEWFFEQKINQVFEENIQIRDPKKLYDLLIEMRKRTNQTVDEVSKGLRVVERSLRERRLSMEDEKRLKKIDRRVEANQDYLKIANLLSFRTLDSIGKVRIDTEKSLEEQLIDSLRLQRAVYATIEGTCKAFLLLLDDTLKTWRDYYNELEKKDFCEVNK